MIHLGDSLYILMEEKGAPMALTLFLLLLVSTRVLISKQPWYLNNLWALFHSYYLRPWKSN